MGEYWTMSITDDQTGAVMVDSVPLLSGVYPAANILEQVAYLKIGSAAIIRTNPDLWNENPDEFTLGNGFSLIYGSRTL